MFNALTSKSGPAYPQRKPSPRRYQFDPDGALSAGCQLALLWDYGGSAILNYANPTMTFTTSGTVTSGSSQFGSDVTTVSGSAAFIQMSPALAAPVTGYTVSMLAQFNGGVPATATNKLMADGGSNELLGATTAGFFIAANVTAAVINTQNYSTWTRIVVTYDQVQTANFYANGALVETPAAVGGTVTGPLSIMGDSGLARSWGFPVADLFYWNRMLTAQEVMRNFVSPYRSILRPRFADSNIVGPAVVPKKGSLMLLGVG